MPKYLLVILFVLLPFAGAGSQTSGRSEADELSEAWRGYSHQVEVGDYEASLVYAQRVWELAERLFPETDRQLAAATLNYGHNLLWVGRHEESEKILTTAVKRFEGVYGQNAPELIPALISLAEATATPPTYRPDQKLLDRVHKIAKVSYDNLSIDYADNLLEIARVSFFDPPTKETGELIRKAHGIYRAQKDAPAAKIGEASLTLGIYHGERGELEKAQKYLGEALEAVAPATASLNDFHVEARMYLAAMLETNGMRDQATDHLVAIGKLLESSSDFDPKRPMIRQAPNYPAPALSKGHTGYVDLAFTVDQNGFVVDPEVITFAGSETFEEAALAAVLKFRYVPKFVAGNAVAQYGMSTRITFSIAESDVDTLSAKQP